MPFLELHDLPIQQPVPGFKVVFVHSDNMTFAHWDVEPGSILPEHSHPHEQVVNMIEGQFELTIGDETQLLSGKSVAVIPSNAVHSGKAVSQCRIIDVFYPVREDYR
jgi:quercetin dioxygenase-like cupin family protein